MQKNLRFINAIFFGFDYTTFLLFSQICISYRLQDPYSDLPYLGHTVYCGTEYAIGLFHLMRYISFPCKIIPATSICRFCLLQFYADEAAGKIQSLESIRVSRQVVRCFDSPIVIIPCLRCASAASTSRRDKVYYSANHCTKLEQIRRRRH